VMGMLGVEPREFFTLMLLYTITGSYGAPATPAQIRLWSRYIYSSRDLLTEPLEILESKGLILQDMEGGYIPTPWARGAVESVHEAAWAHLSRMEPLAPDPLMRLAEELERAAQAVREDPALGDRPGTHLAGSRSLAWFPHGSHPMVRIEQAIYDLWLARDDAHIAAWRDAGLEGPQVQALSLLWSGETSSAAALTELLKEDATPEDVEATLAILMEKGYVTRDEDSLTLMAPHPRRRRVAARQPRRAGREHPFDCASCRYTITLDTPSPAVRAARPRIMSHTSRTYMVHSSETRAPLCSVSLELYASQVPLAGKIPRATPFQIYAKPTGSTTGRLTCPLRYSSELQLSSSLLRRYFWLSTPHQRVGILNRDLNTSYSLTS
jgi:hypothetical protein